MNPVDDKEYLLQLYPKLLSDQISEQELEWLTQYFNGGDSKVLIGLIRSELNLDAELSETAPGEKRISEEGYTTLVARLEGFYEDKEATRPLITKLWPRIAAAAVVLMVAGAGLFFYLNSRKSDLNVGSVYANDIAPGKVGATLTLANGKKIRLADAANGEIAKEAGISVTKAADGQLVYQIEENTDEPSKINTLSTAKGETYILTLPDKSKVWLNAASSLTYTASLNERGKRVVRLSGEGYFEITKDKAHPFIVQTDNQEVEVLGTHFNVNSYKDETAVATTLIEGSVRVTSSLPQAKRSKILKPGEQALNIGNSIKVVEANIENVIDWKDGDFFLNRVNFKTAMRKIARWYDVEVIYDASVPDDIKSGGWISRDNNLSAVLKSIALTGQVKFRIEGKKLYVSK